MVLKNDKLRDKIIGLAVNLICCIAVVFVCLYIGVKEGQTWTLDILLSAVLVNGIAVGFSLERLFQEIEKK